MKTKTTLLLTIITIFISLSACAKATPVSASGILSNGVRNIHFDQSYSSNLSLTVFKGDYVRFKQTSSESLSLSIPSLETSLILTNGIKSPIVKFEEEQTIAFNLGDKKGTIKVVEFRAANYVNINAREAIRMLSEVGPLILDVRTPGEFNGGHLPGAHLIPVQIFEQNIESLFEFKNTPILVYCRTGNRSRVAGKILIDNGFTEVYNVDHGIVELMRAGAPIAR